MFNTKFFHVQAKFCFAELDRARQLGKDLHIYVRRFYEKALDCCDLVEEEKPVNVCLHGMMEVYKIFLENLSFRSFSKLMEAPERTNESVHRTSRSSAATRPNHPFKVRLAPKGLH